MTLREKIKIHKITRNKSLFNEIENEYHSTAEKCRYCNNSIVYPNTF